MFFFNDAATTEIYTLSLHDALPISRFCHGRGRAAPRRAALAPPVPGGAPRGDRGPSRPDRGDRKSTRLNSSHANISYAVFCLKKKTTNYTLETRTQTYFTYASCSKQ